MERNGSISPRKGLHTLCQFKETIELSISDFLRILSVTILIILTSCTSNLSNENWKRPDKINDVKNIVDIIKYYATNVDVFEDKFYNDASINNMFHPNFISVKGDVAGDSVLWVKIDFGRLKKTDSTENNGVADTENSGITILKKKEVSLTKVKISFFPGNSPVSQEDIENVFGSSWLTCEYQVGVAGSGCLYYKIDSIYSTGKLQIIFDQHRLVSNVSVDLVEK